MSFPLTLSHIIRHLKPILFLTLLTVLLYRSIAEKGPTAEEKIASLEAVVSNYEAKVSGLEHEIETQRESYEQKLLEFSERFYFKNCLFIFSWVYIFNPFLLTSFIRLEAIESNLKNSSQENEKRAIDSEKTLVDALDKMKEEMRAKFGDVSTKVDNLNDNLKVSEDGGSEKFKKVEQNFSALQTALRDIQTDNSEKIKKIGEDTRNSRDLLTWMEAKIKESKVEYTGKIHEIAHVTREQVG